MWSSMTVEEYGVERDAGLRELARRDPWYVPIMMRSRTLRGRYPARASASASE